MVKKPIMCLKNDDKGFSLVELLVSILVMSVITGMVVMLISNSLRLYREVNTDAVMQGDVETVRKYIGEMAVESRSWGESSYSYVDDESNTQVVDFIWFKALDNETEGVDRGSYNSTYTHTVVDAEGKTVLDEHGQPLMVTDPVTRQYYYYVFLLRPDGYLSLGKFKYDNNLLGTNGKLFDTGFTLPATDEFGNNILTDPYAILAEHVSALTCSNSSATTEPELINVTMELSYNDEIYNATMNFSGRNKVSKEGFER